MMKKPVTLTLPGELLEEPVIHTIGQQFRLITNIRRADVSRDRGWLVLELEGEEADIEQAIAWMTSKGVRVDDAIGDIGWS